MTPPSLASVMSSHGRQLAVDVMVAGQGFCYDDPQHMLTTGRVVWREKPRTLQRDETAVASNLLTLDCNVPSGVSARGEDIRSGVASNAVRAAIGIADDPRGSSCKRVRQSLAYTLGVQLLTRTRAVFG